MRQLTRYSEAFKRQVIKEYLTTDLTSEEICKKYNIGYLNNIYRWRKKYESEFDVWDMDYKAKFTVMSKEQKKSAKELQHENELLKKALKDAELKNYGFKRLIENWEKELGRKLPKK
ncbi:transposase [Luteibaculum oceani]|uniref:Transposase n=1 Tax=Luteibaculum oceani TaxID=1294296 RepID=A0A5C6VK43_9FLAO|nr:transposase [Luteibaculum oceani]TXC85450.1 transposase [Luteibaculum oceani]